MNACDFHSPLAARLQSFLTLRGGLGRNENCERRNLRYLDRFLQAELKPGQAITREVVSRWMEAAKTWSVNTRINHLSILRQFCRYLSHFDRRTYIVPRNLLPRRTRPAPYIYSRREVRALMREAWRVGPRGSPRTRFLATLIGLLYATGLRVGEALKLTLADVDLTRRVLDVRLSKFHKSRHVPLSPSVATALASYLKRRKAAGFSTQPMDAVFMSPTGRAYSHVHVTMLFLKAARKLHLRGPKGIRGPRIHDFRHTFAVHRLAAWYRQNAEIHAKLPLLSTYLGHSTLLGTQLYLHATAELLEQANQRFRRRCAVPLTYRKEVSHGS